MRDPDRRNVVFTAPRKLIEALDEELAKRDPKREGNLPYAADRGAMLCRLAEEWLATVGRKIKKGVEGALHPAPVGCNG